MNITIDIGPIKRVIDFVQNHNTAGAALLVGWIMLFYFTGWIALGILLFIAAAILLKTFKVNL